MYIFVSLHLLWWKQGPVQSTFADYNYYFTICTYLDHGAWLVPPVQNAFEKENKILETCNTSSLPLDEIIFGWSHHRPEVKKTKKNNHVPWETKHSLAFRRFNPPTEPWDKSCVISLLTSTDLATLLKNGIEHLSAVRVVHSTKT